MLQLRMLDAVSSVNAFRHVTEISNAPGTPLSIYFQLVDTSQLLVQSALGPWINRYIPAAGSSMSVQFINLDSAKQFARVAVNPFADDRSIWRVNTLSTDPLLGTISLSVTLTESGVAKTIFAQAVLEIDGGPDAC